ncbi:Diacylglycerol kinase [Recurvomyces mirabilis]|nr:Diacylglycerol kinase [Recurvomyces mirabilis]
MSSYQVPATPRVISPSPTPSEQSNRDGYFPSTSQQKTAIPPIEEDEAAPNGSLGAEDPELARARARSRSPQIERRPQTRAMGTTNGSLSSSVAGSKPLRSRKEVNRIQPVGGGDDANGLLSPESARKEGEGFGAAYWRSLSRSPSPLGLIPIHREWRAFVHKHEVPRKVLHVSIGFLALYLYSAGFQPTDIHPFLLSLLIPIGATDLLRFRWPALNRVYIRALGPFMREAEAHDQFNGVISYLAGIWFTMRFCRKDVAIMSVLLLSWCDTAASTIGRAWGRYTPRIRRGKSLAGSLAAFVVGVGCALLFWGGLVPASTENNTGINSFAFQGHLDISSRFQGSEMLKDFGMLQSYIKVTGWPALAVLSVISGLAASSLERSFGLLVNV